MLFADLHILPMLRMSGAIPQLSFLACTVLSCDRVVVPGHDEALRYKE
jgi:hypothetical protein